MGKNELKVKYHNDLNAVIMRKWTPQEMNLFFSILATLLLKAIMMKLRSKSFHSWGIMKYRIVYSEACCFLYTHCL